MAQQRSVENRKSETREQDVRATAAWSPPSVLEAPPVRPGFRQRWIATSILGKDVPHQAAKRFREGWVPRKSDTVKDFAIPTVEHGQYAGCIGVEGMILCEMPEEMVQQRTAYYDSKLADQNTAAVRDLEKTARAGGIPIDVEGETRVERGGGRGQPPVMDD